MTTTDPHRWAKAFPELGTGPLSLEPYVSPSYFEAEKEKIFKKVWLCVGREEEVAEPGDYKVKRIHAADTSVILIRGKDKVVRAFHNMCSHRGNTVITETGHETLGSCTGAVMACRFHGWAYGGDGRLIGVPQEERFYDCFDKAKNGLAPVHCDIWEGFIFVCVADTPPVSLREYLGDYANHFAGFPFSEITFGFKYHTYLNCNWKVGHDSFLETYHVPFLHWGFPHTTASGPENVKFFGPHRTCGIMINYTGEPTAVATLANELARGSLVTRVEGTSLPPTINPTHRPDYSFELSCCFPNFLLHVAEGIWFTNTFWPISHDRCLWEGSYHVRAPHTYSERWAIEQAIVLQRNTWLEDTATMENTQRAMMSGAKRIQNLQDEEVLIRHGYENVQRYVHA
jgi:phenylpropionate dioxygenase-like ring-hydroxylating dioxygenase large terminal subunit